MYYVLKLIIMKYRLIELKIIDGCVCLIFFFDIYDSLEKYLNLFWIGDEDLWRDIMEVIFNKIFLEIFYIDYNYVVWFIDKVIVMRGL